MTHQQVVSQEQVSIQLQARVVENHIVATTCVFLLLCVRYCACANVRVRVPAKGCGAAT